MRRGGFWVGCVLGTVLVGLVAPDAEADGVVTRADAELRYESDPQDAENLGITKETEPAQCPTVGVPCVRFANGPQDIREVAANCAKVSGQPVVVCSATLPIAVTSIFLDLDDGDDVVSVGNELPAATMDGSIGNDELTSASGADTVLGGPGVDTIFDDDSGGGKDVLNAGGDDDTIRLERGDDTVIGGAGFDTATLDSAGETVRLDNIANDGRTGEMKNIRADIEVINGGGGNDILVGNDAANTFNGGSGDDTISGEGGPDALEGNAGADELNGGADFDRVIYSNAAGQTVTLDDARDDGAPGELDNVHSDIEDVTGGPGNDVVVGSDAANVLDGGDGDDRLDGRGGVDTYFAGAGADALFARDGVSERVECGSELDTGEADTIDLLAACEGVAVSAELVPDADGDGATKQSDCDDANAGIHPGAVDVAENGIDEDCSGADAVNLDRDGDGSPRPADCDDGNARVHPGARDKPGNRIDEDCRGGPAPFPLLASTIGIAFRFSSASTEFTALTIRRVRAGTTLRLTCRGGGCSFRTRSRQLERDRRKLVLRRPLGRARLLPGARFEVRLTKPRTVGVVARYTVRAGQPPALRQRCLRPGAKRPTRCPA